MSDPLGLLPENDSSQGDPLGLLDTVDTQIFGSNVIPIRQPGQGNEAMRIFAPAKVKGLTLYEPGNEFGGEPSLSVDKGYSAPEWLQSVFDSLSLTGEYQGERAKSANIMAISQEYGISPSRAERDFNSITGEVFTRDRLPDMSIKVAGETAMLVGVARLAMTHPIAALVSIPAFAGLSALSTALMERGHGIPDEGLTGFLPGNTIQPVKDMVWLAETVAQAYAVSPLFRLGKGLDARYTDPLKKRVMGKWFKDVTEVYKSPESVYFPAGKIRNFFGGGKVGDELSPEEFDILQTYGIPREYYRTAIKQGLDIEIPAEKIVTSADKPWWNDVKNIFRISPQWEPPVETTVFGGGAATARPHVSGLLEAPPATERRGFMEIFKDLNRLTGESGQIGEQAKTPEQKAAGDRLKNDLEIIKKEAEAAGKGFKEYLREVGFDEAAIAAAGQILGDVEPTPLSMVETVYHGGAGIESLTKKFSILTPEEKQKLPSSSVGLTGLSMTTDRGTALEYSRNIGGTDKVFEAKINPEAKIYEVDTKGDGIDDFLTDDQVNKIKADGFDAIRDIAPNGEKEFRALTENAVVSPSPQPGATPKAVGGIKEIVDAYKKAEFNARNTDVPDGWYIRGSSSGLSLQETVDKYPAEFSRGWEWTNWDESHGNPNNGTFAVRPKKEADVLDFSDPFTDDMDRIVEVATKQLKKGNPQLDLLREGFSLPLKKGDAVELENALRQSLTPEDMGEHSGAYENPDVMQWLFESIDVDFVKTPDGGVMLQHPERFDVVRLNDHLKESLPTPSLPPEAVGGIEENALILREREKFKSLAYNPARESSGGLTADQINKAGGTILNREEITQGRGVGFGGQREVIEKIDYTDAEGRNKIAYVRYEFDGQDGLYESSIISGSGKEISPNHINAFFQQASKEDTAFVKDIGKFNAENKAHPAYWVKVLGEKRDTINKALMKEYGGDFDKASSDPRWIGDSGLVYKYAQMLAEGKSLPPEAIKTYSEVLPTPSLPPEAVGGIRTFPISESVGAIANATNLQKTQIPDLADETNTLLALATSQDTATGVLPDNPAYDQIRAEAARLAWDKIKKKQDFMNKRNERAAINASLQAARETPLQLAMAEAIKAGGINYDAIRADYSAETIKELNRKRPGLVAKEGKARLDELAAEHGFESDDILIEAILSADTIMETGLKIKRGFDEMMANELEDMSEDTGYLIDVLREEEKILTKLLKGNAPKPDKGLKKFIREETGQVRVGELVVSEYDALKAAMKKAETASRIAYREGNKLGALTEKTRQREIAETLKTRLDAKTEAKKIHDGIIKLSKNTKIPLDYQDQIATLLEGYDLLPRSSRGERQVESLQGFLDRAEAEGETVDIPRSLLAKVERYGRVHWKDLTLDQLRDIYDQATMIEHLGKLKDKLIGQKEMREKEAAVNRIVETTARNFNINQEVYDARLREVIQESLTNPGWFKKLLEFYDGVGPELVKPERFFRLMDKWEDLGPVWRELYLQVKEANDAEIRMQTKYGEKVKEIFDLEGQKWTEKTTVPGIKNLMSREAIVLTALNTGNEGNLDALRYGKRQWSDEQIQNIVSALTADEKKLVDNIWDLIESFFLELAAVYERLTGTRLKKVEGRYFPLAFDQTLSNIVDKFTIEQLNRDFYQTIYATRPSPGFTNERTGGKFDPKLRLSVIFKHISDVIHYITHAEAIRNTHKLLLDPRVRAVMQSIPEIGDKGYKEVVYWLQDLSKPKIEPVGSIESGLAYVRGAAQTAIMGTFSVAGAQLTQIAQTINELGLFKTLDGLARFYSDPLKIAADIRSMSAEMSVSWTSSDRELRDAYDRLGLDRFYNLPWAKDFIFGTISALDMMVRYPTWLEAKRIGLDKFRNEKDGNEYADMITRNSQGVAFMKDLAAIQRGGMLKRLLTMFYTFANNFHNIMWELEKKWKYAGGMKIPETINLARAFFIIIMIPALADIVRHREEMTLKNVGKETVMNFFSRYPLVRDIARSVIDGYNYRFTPATAGIEKGIQFAKEPTIVHGVEAMGYWVPGGFPSEMASITLQGFLDLKAGKTNDFTRLFFREPQKQK